MKDKADCFVAGMVIGMFMLALIVSEIYTHDSYIENGTSFQIGNSVYKCERTQELKLDER